MPGSPARRRSQEKGAPFRAEPDDHALGRSRGGPSTKVHLVSDSHARPLTLRVSASPRAKRAMRRPSRLSWQASVFREVDREDQRTRPDVVLADRAYSSRAIRAHLRRRGIRAVIPQPADQVGHRLRRGRAGGRPPGFDAEAYKQRNAVERCINRLKQWRDPAMRTDKLAIAYQAALHLAAILMWTRP
nr:IS5 family transposase [Streptomyces rubrogriseus]